MKHRIFYLDFLRTTAIIAVIMCHSTVLFTYPNNNIQLIAQYTFQDIGAIGVPIFLMLSGALLLNNKDTITEFIKKRFRRIIPPFLFWSMIIWCTNPTQSYLSNIITGNTEFSWYFWIIVGIYLVMPVLDHLIKKYNLKTLLIIWLLAMALTTFNIIALPGFIGYAGYPLLGYWLKNRKDSHPYLESVIFIIALILSVYLHCTHKSMISLGYQSLAVISMSAAMFLLIKSLNAITNKFIKTAIVSISIYSYGMFFAHILAIKLFSLIGLNVMLFGITFILIIFISWLIPYVLSKIPYLRIVSGMH